MLRYVIPTALLSLALVSCGGDDSDDSSSSSSVSYSDVSTFLSQHCYTCHSQARAAAEGGGVEIYDETTLKATASSSLAEIKAETMPTAGSDEKTSWDENADRIANVKKYLESL